MILTKAIWSFRGPKGVRFEVLSGAAAFYTLFAGTLVLFQGMSIGVLLYPLLFLLAVLTHEWGHAWSAIRQGFAVKRIALTFGGGQCDTDGGDVGRAFRMVLMGPVASLGMAVLSLLASVGVATYMTLKGVDPSLITEHTQLWVWLLIFALINLAFCLLNLFPFQPLDGGKLLHLGLACVLPPHRACRIAGAVGLVLGIIWLPVMLWLLTWGLLIPVLPHLQTHWNMVFGRDTGAEVLAIQPTAQPA